MIKLTFSNPLLSCYCSQGSPKIDLKKDGYLFADNRVINKKIKKDKWFAKRPQLIKKHCPTTN